MKQSTDKIQTRMLLEMGYPPSGRWFSTSGNPTPYSIGELLSLIEQNNIVYSLQRGSSGKYLFMKYYPFAEIEGEDLIEVLFKACVKFKKD